MAKTVECDDLKTKYQPTKEELSCPKCGAECGVFCIDESTCDACDGAFTHQNEVWRCTGKLPSGLPCTAEFSGRTLAARIAKKKNLIPCPTCHGHGMVKRTGS